LEKSSKVQNLVPRVYNVLLKPKRQLQFSI